MGSFGLRSDSNCKRDRSLIVVHLRGGNDGYNTLVPYTSSCYFKARPGLALAPSQVLKLNENFGLNPSLNELYRLRENLAVFPRVGWPNQTKSHTLASEIWHSGSPEDPHQSSWLDDCGYAERFCRSDQAVAKELAKAETLPVIRDRSSAKKVLPLLDSRTPVVANIVVDGFDTHHEQNKSHPHLLRLLSTLIDDIVMLRRREFSEGRLLFLIHSEFNRSLAENEWRGTDHGGYGPVFLISKSITGRVFDDCHQDSFLDFRRLYTTISTQWLALVKNNLASDVFEPLAGLFS